MLIRLDPSSCFSITICCLDSLWSRNLLLFALAALFLNSGVWISLETFPQRDINVVSACSDTDLVT